MNHQKIKFGQEFKNEYFGRYITYLCGGIIILLTAAILFFLTVKGSSLFLSDKYSISSFLFSSNWNPELEESKGGPQFGTLIFIVGSTLASIGAVLFSAPVAISLAIFIVVISPKLGTRLLQPAMELFVGIPSVVYGWIGITLLVPIIKSFSSLGFSLLSGMIVLSIMILPTITSIAIDSIKNVPKEHLEASYGLGATRFQTILHIILPTSFTGILTGIILGLARAFGEALAVQMVIGNSIKFPKGPLDTTTTITSILTMDMANTVFGTPWNNAMWSLALLLLILSFSFILLIRYIGSKKQL